MKNKLAKKCIDYSGYINAPYKVLTDFEEWEKPIAVKIYKRWGYSEEAILAMLNGEKCLAPVVKTAPKPRYVNYDTGYDSSSRIYKKVYYHAVQTNKKEPPVSFTEAEKIIFWKIKNAREL